MKRDDKNGAKPAQDQPFDAARRRFFAKLGGVAAAGASGAAYAAWGGHTLSDAFADFFQQHYQRMTEGEIRDTIERIERKAERRYGVQLQCDQQDQKYSWRCHALSLRIVIHIWRAQILPQLTGATSRASTAWYEPSILENNNV